MTWLPGSAEWGPWASLPKPALLVPVSHWNRTSITPMVLQLWKFVTGSKWFWRREKTGAERSLSSGSLLNHAFFLERSHIYMINLHVAVTVTEYFQESGIINVLAVWDCFFPNCKCCSICHKTISSNSLTFPIKGASQHIMFVTEIWGEEGDTSVWHIAVVSPVGEELALRKQTSWGGVSSFLFSGVGIWS